MSAARKKRAPPLSVRRQPKAPPLPQAPPLQLPTGSLMQALTAAEQCGDAVRGAQQQQQQVIDRAQRAEGLVGQGAGAPGVGPEPALVHEPGGDMQRQMLHPSFLVFERLFRALPDEGMFSPLLNSDKPFQFTIGTYTVPKSQALWFSDYRNGLLLLDGVNPGDFREAEDGRFSGVLGYDVSVNGRRFADIQYQLDPVPIQNDQPQFAAQPGTARATQAQFNRAAAQSFAAAAGTGLSTLPQRRAVQGPDNNNPWTWILKHGDRISIKCIIFRPILSPIAAIFSRIAGHLLDESLSDTLVQRLRPR